MCKNPTRKSSMEYKAILKCKLKYDIMQDRIYSERMIEFPKGER